MKNDKFETIRKHGKTFYRAGLLLPNKTFKDLAIFYDFCRKMDDAIDEENDPSKVDLAINDLSTNYPEISNLVKKYDIPDSFLNFFLNSLKSDIAPVKLKTEKELFEYCYGVAGCVGAMACFILRCKNSNAIYHAIDLGIAMQLTNISRDMYEDGINNRIYIPEKHTQTSLIKLAEKYYLSGKKGIKYLPFSVRPAIMTALTNYKEVGNIIVKNPDYAEKNRVIVSNKRKFLLTIYSIIKCFLLDSENAEHDKSLHEIISNLPNTHAA